MKKIKIKRLRDIIPLIEEGKSTSEIGKLTGKDTSTIFRYKQILRANGFTIESRPKGRPKNII